MSLGVTEPAGAPALPGSADAARSRPVRERWRQHQRHQAPPWWLVAPAFVAATIAVLPVWYLLVRTGSLTHALDQLLTVATARLTLRSVILAATVTALATAVGVVAAWLVARSDLPGRRLWSLAMVVPLAVPSYIAAFVWLDVAPGLAGFPGAVLVLTLTTFPYVFLPALAALRRIDPALEEVAASLGHGRLAVARLVTAPQVRASVAAGALLVALYVLSDFGAVALMRYEVFTWVIYGAYRSGFDPTRAAVLSLLLVLLAALLVTAEARARGRARSRLGPGVPRRGRVIHLGGAGRLAGLGFMSAVVTATVLVPALSIVRWWAEGSAESLDLGEFWAALSATLELALMAAAACVVLAVPVGVLAARHRGPVSLLLERATFIGHALPGIVVAISMVFVGVRLLRPVYQEVPLLVLAYVVLFLPLAVVAVRTAVESSPIQAEDAGRSLGLSRWAVLRRVTLPVATPGIAAGAAMVVLTTMKELPATLLLHPTGVETLATQLWHSMLISDHAGAAPYAALIVLGAALPAVLLGRIGQAGSP